MARAHRKTQTTSGTVTVKQLNVPADLGDVITAYRREHDREEGEMTLREIADAQGMAMDEAQHMMDRMLKAGLATRRKPGKLVLYRAVTGKL